MLHRLFLVSLAMASLLSGASLAQNAADAQRPAAAQTPPPLRPPTRADILRGADGRYRANNDLLFYHLDIRVDPGKKFISGRNTIRFKMVKDDTRIQLDLYANLDVDRILLGKTTLKYEREMAETLPQSRHRRCTAAQRSRAALPVRRFRGCSEGTVS